MKGRRWKPVDWSRHLGRGAIKGTILTNLEGLCTAFKFHNYMYFLIYFHMFALQSNCNLIVNIFVNLYILLMMYIR